MNIALIGYGKLGRTIEKLGIALGHSFPVIIDVSNKNELQARYMPGVDVAIEFSVPESAPENIRKCIDMKLPVVSGTTGWNRSIPGIEAYCREKNGTLFYSSNFSVGVNILFAMNRKLAAMMSQFPEYSVSMREVHHVHKKDAPSGTAITLAEQILVENSAIKGWYLKESGNEKRNGDEALPIEAIREDEVVGEHIIHYESPMDSVSLIHSAKTRDAFAAGALLAASFIKGKKGVFGMQDLLNL